MADADTAAFAAPAILAEVKPAILTEVRPAELPRPPLVLNNRSFAWITDKICGIIEGPTPRWWWISFGLALFVAS
ncbi:MAG TPA: hydrogenase, partial [Opitutaceae bacterium]|nr:hydrogenase [Opitutaceae bacterium]